MKISSQINVKVIQVKHENIKVNFLTNPPPGGRIFKGKDFVVHQSPGNHLNSLSN